MIARKFVPLRDFSSCEFTPLKESKCKILHPRRSCITPLNVPYSVFWHAYHRKFTADYAFGARFQAANRAISAPSASRQQSRLRRRCSASTAVNFDSSELFARCGRSLLWLEQTSSPRGKNIRSPSAKTSSDLCSTLLLFRCSGLHLRRA